MERKCRACDYYGVVEDIEDVGQLGRCRRYPEVVDKAGESWCGEWKPIGYMEWSFRPIRLVSREAGTDAGK